MDEKELLNAMIDLAIYASELETANGGREEGVDEVFDRLNRKYYGLGQEDQNDIDNGN
jgi:hypothetical protein